MSRRYKKRHRWPSRRPRVSVPPAAQAIVAQLADEIDEFTARTRDPGWCHELAERLAERFGPLVARTTSTDGVLADVRAARHRHDRAGLTGPDRLLVLAGLVDQLAMANTVQAAYAHYVAIAAAAVAAAESLTTPHAGAGVAS